MGSDLQVQSKLVMNAVNSFVILAIDLQVMQVQEIDAKTLVAVCRHQP